MNFVQQSGLQICHLTLSCLFSQNYPLFHLNYVVHNDDGAARTLAPKLPSKLIAGGYSSHSMSFKPAFLILSRDTEHAALRLAVRFGPAPPS